MFQSQVPAANERNKQTQSQRTKSSSNERRKRSVRTHSSISEFDFTKKNQGVGFNIPPPTLLFSTDPPAPASPKVSLKEGVDDDGESLSFDEEEVRVGGRRRGRWIRIAFRLAKSSGSGVFGGLW